MHKHIPCTYMHVYHAVIYHAIIESDKYHFCACDLE